MKIESVALIFQGACNQTHEGHGEGQGAEIGGEINLVFRGGCIVALLLYSLLHEQIGRCHIFGATSFAEDDTSPAKVPRKREVLPRGSWQVEPSEPATALP